MEILIWDFFKVMTIDEVTSLYNVSQEPAQDPNGRKIRAYMRIFEYLPITDQQTLTAFLDLLESKSILTPQRRSEIETSL